MDKCEHSFKGKNARNYVQYNRVTLRRSSMEMILQRYLKTIFFCLMVEYHYSFQKNLTKFFYILGTLSSKYIKCNFMQNSSNHIKRFPLNNNTHPVSNISCWRNCKSQCIITTYWHSSRTLVNDQLLSTA